MENKSIKKLYELVQSDETLKNRLLQIDKRYENKEFTYENFLDVVNNNIIPIAKEYGITLTQEDIINKTKAGLNKLSDVDLMDVSGGFSPKVAALTLSTIFLISLGSGSISSVSALGSKGENTSKSFSTNKGIRSTGRGLLLILKSLPANLKLGLQKTASLFKQKEVKSEETILDSSGQTYNEETNNFPEIIENRSNEEVYKNSDNIYINEEREIQNKDKSTNPETISESKENTDEENANEDVNKDVQTPLDEKLLTNSGSASEITKEDLEDILEKIKKLDYEKLNFNMNDYMSGNIDDDLHKDMQILVENGDLREDRYQNVVKLREESLYKAFQKKYCRICINRIINIALSRLKRLIEIDKSLEYMEGDMKGIIAEQVNGLIDYLNKNEETYGKVKNKYDEYLSNHKKLIEKNAGHNKDKEGKGSLLKGDEKYDDFKLKPNNEKEINADNGLGPDDSTKAAAHIPEGRKRALSDDRHKEIKPIHQKLDSAPKKTEQGQSYSLEELRHYCKLILALLRRETIETIETIVTSEFGDNYIESFCKTQGIDYQKFINSLSSQNRLSENFKKIFVEILNERIRNKASRVADTRINHKVADQRNSSGKGHTPLAEKSSKGPQTESENMKKILHETLTKIKKAMLQNPKLTQGSMEENIKFATPKQCKSIIKYLKDNTQIGKKFKKQYDEVLTESKQILGLTQNILGQLKDSDLAFKTDFKKYFRDKINDFYRKKESPILKEQDKDKNIEQRAKERANKVVTRGLDEKVKALEPAKEIKNESIEDTAVKIAPKNNDKDKGMQASSKNHLVKTGSNRRNDKNKAVQRVETKPKQSEGLKADLAENPNKHLHSSKDGHNKRIHTALSLNYEELLQIAQSAIQGLAVGDAAGVPFEFKWREEVKGADLPTSKGGFTKPKGQDGWWGGTPKNLHVKQGFWSDDTSMTLCLMSSIIDNGGKIVPNDVMKRFASWSSQNVYAPDGYQFDIGNQVEAAVKEYKKLVTTKREIKEAFKAKQNNNAGNGALMRIMPMAFYLAAHPEISEADGVKLIKDIAELTHNDYDSYSDVGCVIYTLMNKNLILDRTGKGAQEKLRDAFDKAIKSTKELCSTELKKAGGKYERLLKGYNSFAKIKKDAIDRWNGFTPFTLESVMYSLMHSEKYTDCIRTAILMGYDTDTVASIAGGTAGILYKLETIPSTWKKQLAKTINKEGNNVSIEQCTKDFIDAIFSRKQ